MPSLTSWIVRLVIIWVRRSKGIYSNAQKTTKSIEDFHIRPESFSPPQSLGPDISVSRKDLTEWPLYRVSATGRPDQASKADRGAVLYIHGGAFYREMTKQHWQFTAQIARGTGLDVLVPIYPLIPRPGATAAKLAQGLMEICRLSTQPVVCIAGDSAGGMLTLSTTQQLQIHHTDLFARLRSIVLISPVLDNSLAHPEVRELVKVDPWLGIDGLRVLTEDLTAGLPIDDPVVSPLFGNIEGLPPVLLFAGTHDMLCSDARRLSAKYQGQGTERGLPGSFQNEKLTFVEKPGMIHVYPLLPHPEGAEARELMMHFINRHAA
jgi:acetyl esterase/lipase